MMEPRLLTRFLSAFRARLAEAIAELRALRRRLGRRPGAIGCVLILLIAMMLFGGLTGAAALAGFAVLAAIIAGSESGDDEGPTGLRETSNVTGTPSGPDREPASWRPLLDAVPDAAVALDRNLHVLHFNARFKELFPIVRPGQPLSHLSRNPELNAAAERAALTSEAVVVDLYERVPVERRISASVSRLDDSGSRRGLPLLLITFRDLTEQDKLAQMRSDFIANASHELRTPLASLRGFVETLQGPARDDPEARERFLGIMSSQATRMTRLIDDLLSLSRVEMRAHLPPKGIVDLNETASYVAQALEPVAACSATKILVTKGEGPVRIRGDRDEIVQVLHNLIDNAIKYGREGGRVEVAVSRVLDGSPPMPKVLVAIADDGPGIAPAHLPRLTERFYRADVAAGREKGTGLGLAIVKHIVNRHSGELRIASVAGSGSTFSVLFDEFGPHP